MASSSSSSHSINTSSSQSWNHDVFLSFRVEDTRKTFVDHLYTALVQQGIHTYKDDETLPRGEVIGPSLLKAIRESRIALIVFSENYANSSWCLDELAYIMECMDKRGQIVMPVFYDVNPSDIRKQKGKYGEAFAKHELENNNKIELWRKSLAKAGNLSGWVPKDIANGHEAKCIKDIVGTISRRLFPLTTNVNRVLIGIETRLQDLYSQLEIGSGGVRMVGIWGVGGGGKTTLAASAYKEISHHFEAHCFLENIREESGKYGLTKLQEKILSLVLKTKVKVESEEEGRSMIKSRFCHKNVLIVLDDVDDIVQLEVLAGSHDWFGEGSRIIITTRDEHMLTRKADVIYGVSLLSHDEAIELFRRHAYREDNPVEAYEMLSLDVVSYAGGLPLALKILGSFLYDKNKDEWMSALAKLKDIPNPRIMDKLKVSYDGLQDDEKELFLDIACFLKRSPINTLTMMELDAGSFHPVIGIKVLAQKSLINVSNGKFDMHDLIKEMAHHIVKGELHCKHPETHSRIWREEDILEICSMDTTKENDKIEVLALPGTFSHPRLPFVVSNMKNLRWLIWEGYRASSLPKTFHPMKIRCLMLARGSLKQLWQGYKHLPNLKMLELSALDIIRTPDFNGLPCLETLVLSYCKKLKIIHPSIGYHKRLVYIDMEECSNLKRFPDIKTNMDSLKTLILNYTAINILPSSVGQFCTNLVSLKLKDCDKLKRIEGNFRLLKYLKEFHLDGCRQLERLAEDFFDVECCLEVLTVCVRSHLSISFKHPMNCFLLIDEMGMRFPSFPRFLKKLNLSSCELLDEYIPSDICELFNLQVLDLSENHYLTRLHCNLSRLPRLKFLNLSDCYGLVELPDLPSSIAVLNASSCNSLESVRDLSHYKWLWKVSFWRKKKLIDGERILHSMLQGNAVEDQFISVTLAGGPRHKFGLAYDMPYILQLPHNWNNDFSGFLVWIDRLMPGVYPIIIKQTTCKDSQLDYWEEFNKNPESDEYAMVGYISFGSLKHTSWWNSAYTALSFHVDNGEVNFKVGLVPRNSKCDSKEIAKDAIDCSEFWDEDVKDNKTFKIMSDSKSSVEILWSHSGLLYY